LQRHDLTADGSSVTYDMLGDVHKSGLWFFISAAEQSSLGRLRRGPFDPRELWDSFLSFVYVFNIALQNQKIRSRPSINFQRSSIVPFDRTFNFFAVLQNEYHLRMGVDLFLVIVDFGVRLRRRRLPLAYLDGRRRRLRRALLWHTATPGHIAVCSVALLWWRFSPGFHVGQRRSNKFAIHSSASKKFQKERVRRSNKYARTLNNGADPTC
jgi:hypothetical protein